MAKLAQETGAIDVERIRKPVRKLRKFLKKSLDEPSADKIHNLRTSARRFQTAAETLDQSSGKKRKKLLKDLSKVRSSAGKIRDMDVLISKVATLEMDEEEACLVRLLEKLEDTRSKHLKKLRTLVARRGQRLRRRLEKEASHMVSIAEAPPADAHADELRELLAHALRLTRALKAPAQLNRRNLHSYRVKVRELAYLLQMARSGDEKQFVKKLLEVKDAIGEWHDWCELLAIAGNTLKHGKDCRLLRSLRIITAAKYTQALQITSRMRSSFLKPAAIRAQLFGAQNHGQAATGNQVGADDEADLFRLKGTGPFVRRMRA